MAKLKQIKKADYQNFIQQFEALMQEFNATLKPFDVQKDNFYDWYINTKFGKLRVGLLEPESKMKPDYTVYGVFEDVSYTSKAYTNGMRTLLDVDPGGAYNHYFPDDSNINEIIQELKKRFECLKIK